MIKTFLEMGFSVQGLHQKTCDGIYTNREGWLYRKNGDKYTPLKPNIGNSRHIGNRGSYFYFQVDGQSYKVFQEEIQENGLSAKAHKV